MSSEQRPVDPHAVEETKQQIRGLVEEIGKLTKKDLAPEVFYGEFLQRVVSALAAVGGAVWIMSDDGPLRLVYQINLRESLPEEQGEDHVRHARLLHRVVRTGEEMLIPPYSGAEGEAEAGNPTSYLLVLSPLRAESQTVGVVEILQRPTSGPASQRGYLRFLSQMCALAGEYLKGRRLRQLTDWQSLFSRADEFSRSVHDSLDPRVTAYTIANEGRRLIGCDRVSVAVRRGNRCVVEAVSGQDTMDSRANTVVLLSKLATAVVRNGEPLWYTGPTDDLPPQIEDAVHAYVDESHSKSVAVLPLRRPKPPEDVEDKRPGALEDPEPVAALIIEQIEDSRPPEAYSDRVDLVTEHSARAMANSLEHNNLFLMPVWRGIGRARWVTQARTLPKTLAIAGAAFVAIVLMFVYPANFNIEGDGKLQPCVRREVFVDVDGTVTEVLVEEGQMINAGDPVAKLRNIPLDVQLEGVDGKLAQAREELTAKTTESMDRFTTPQRKKQLNTEARILREQIKTLQRERKLLLDQRSQLTVKSPIAGQVVTSWNVLEGLKTRTVMKGQALLTVVDPKSEWELEVYMPGDKMGHVAKAEKRFTQEGKPLDVIYVVTNEPENKHEGTVQEIGTSAEFHEPYGHTVPIRVKIDGSQLRDPRYGIEATAKIRCGRRPIGYVWFHELIEFVQTRVLF